MSQPIPLSTLGPIQSIAFAGTDLLVHMTCLSPQGQPFPLALDYPAFARLIRERADRGQAVTLLEAFRGRNLLDSATGNRQWALIDVRHILGCELRLENPDLASETPLSHAA
jgi:hypothetical protein